MGTGVLREKIDIREGIDQIEAPIVGYQSVSGCIYGRSGRISTTNGRDYRQFVTWEEWVGMWVYPPNSDIGMNRENSDIRRAWEWG